jgi:hypothetical protein
MDEVKDNDLSEKIQSINNNNLQEKNEQNQTLSPNIEEQANTNLNISNNIPLDENEQTSIKEDKLKSYTPFIINTFYQILINKKMPSGYKLETEENLLKKDEKRHKGYLHRKHKRNSSSILESKIDSENNNLNIKNIAEDKDNKDATIKPKKSRKKIFPLDTEASKGDAKENKENQSIAVRRMTREHKPKIIEDLGYIDKDVIKGKSNPLFRAVNKICEKGMMKMKKIPYYSFFYNSSKPDEPSLNKIEKNIRDFKYQSTYEFIMDLRRLWNHFLKVYDDQIEIKERVCEMCRISEQLYWELDKINIEKVELEEMNKKVDNLERKLRELKGNSLQFNMGSFSLKKTNSNERCMSFNEKTIIKNNIKLLTIEQKKGIANILRDTIDTANKKVLEFDIDKLNNKKLKQLDEYVKNCLRDNNLNQEKLSLDVQKLKNDLTDVNKSINSNNSLKNNNDHYDIEKDIEKDSSSEYDSSSFEFN